VWVFTDSGFISAVRPSGDHDNVLVRARDAESLDALAKMAGQVIEHSPERDYPYRITASNEVFAKFLTDNVDFMDYTNFKNQVLATRGTYYAKALSSVWSTMHDVEDDEARRYIR
jgi:hypothetical protein